MQKEVLENNKDVDKKDYTINNKVIKCPKCGSNNKAKILYGMPMMDKSLEEKLEREEVVLGGCCIPTYIDDDGMLVKPPKYRCNDCKEEYYIERVPMNED